MPQGEESRVLRCIGCGDLYPGRAANNGDLIPEGAASGGRCHECGGDEFEQVTLAPSD